MIVTIDGPAGAGKSSVARRLAKRLGFQFLDTGAMYRAVAWSLQRNNIPLDDHHAVAGHLGDIQMDVRGEQVLVNGKDITGQLRSPEVSQRASIVAAIPAVRERLVQWQREIAARGNFVCEGRDQGTVVFPAARCKIFLTAAPEIRAARRFEEVRQDRPGLTLEAVVAEQKIRDLRDETRTVGRLEKARDAVEIRVDDLDLEQVIEQIEKLARAALDSAVTTESTGQPPL